MGVLVEGAHAILATNKAIFLALVEKVRTFPITTAEQCIADSNYERLEHPVLEHLPGC